MESLLDLVLLARDYAAPSARAELDREYRAGRLSRLIEGVYVPTAEWTELDETERHLLIAHAAQAIRRRRLVFSHWTAAAAWGLPILGALPPDAHVVTAATSGGRSDERLVRHCVGIPAVTAFVGGIEVTSLAQTVVDLARAAPFETAVVAADAALGRDRGDGKDLEIGDLAEFVGPPGRRGAARARRVLEFADGASGSPGESLSRVTMARVGIPAPILQHRFSDAHGDMYADFWWPEFDLVGEFDGAAKYEDPRYLAGRSPREVLLDEKHREDRIRALGPRVTRWGWKVASSPVRLRAHLVAAGVRLERYRNW